ncbi:hypothetical protein BV898_06424 [Hypsibius exemplaris]|uniref:Uncharacterized protein n=1 Tax=Hypsibius exemplaris TaxID=2072580 RepID=A0A1W0WWV7_HYPEX|nr:hypothetical protein BV898_06424 [Hypsibius exemplaris]
MTIELPMDTANFCVDVFLRQAKAGQRTKQIWSSLNVEFELKKTGWKTGFDTFGTVYAANGLHPGDLKGAVGDVINRLLEPIRQEFSQSEELTALVLKAYPASVG